MFYGFDEIKIKIEKSVFHCRTLTVQEFTSINNRVISGEAGSDIFVDISTECLENWEGVLITDDNGSSSILDFSEEYIELLPVEYLMTIGNKVYEASTNSKEQMDKIVHYVRFFHYMSSDDAKKRPKRFDCLTCVESGKRKFRPCGLSKEAVDKIKRDVGVRSEAEDVRAKFQSSAAKRRQRRRSQRGQSSKSKKLMLGDFQCNQCPVSYVPNDLQQICDILYFSNKAEIPLAGFGLKDWPNLVYETYRIISSESNKIENEEMEKRFNN